MNIKIVPVGILQENCYILWPEGGRDALVIDPGCEPEKIMEVIDGQGLEPRGVLLTHAHVDHIGAVSDICSRYGIGVWCHGEDVKLYSSPANKIPPWIPAAEDLPPIDGEPARVAGLDYQIIHTPGHTPGGVCYYFREEGELFSGDTLFQGTHGRTDFPGGNYEDIVTSIRDRLFTLPEGVRVHPGHGGGTTIGEEKSRQAF